MAIDNKTLAEAAVNKTLYGYAQEYIVLDGVPFSFQGHNYLIQMYTDNHPFQIVEKAAQMGASVIGMIKAFFVCDKLEKNVIYFFPTDEDVREFSKGRVAPLIRDSAHLTNIVGDADAVGLRSVGRGFLYFRGMRSNIRMKSVPADLLVFDELDEVTDAQFDLADQRLNHSSLKWRYMLSTPTFDNYGIDRFFRKSSQQYWNLICKKCDTRNILEKQFPDCIKRLSETKAIIICRKCGSELDNQYGVWIPEVKTERIQGYHLTSLYSVYADLSEILYDFEEGRNREEFMRSKIGIPWVSSDQKLTPEVIERCCERYELGNDNQQHTYMGVDQRGRELHVVIRGRDPYTKRSKILNLAIETKFSDLDKYMSLYDIDFAVVDALPNQHSARDFAKRFPGRVYLCYYNDNQKGSYNWQEPKEGTDGDYQVTVNRTEALDDAFEEIVRREVMLPKADLKVVKTFIEQCCNIARINEEDPDTGVKRAVWKKLGEDHFAHANGYSCVAQKRFAAPAHSWVVQTPLLSQNIVSRRYESGSPY